MRMLGGRYVPDSIAGCAVSAGSARSLIASIIFRGHHAATTVHRLL